MESIEEIEKSRSEEEIQIEAIYNFNYKNIYEFLEGYLKIQLDEKIIENAKNMCKKRESKIKDDKKIKNLEKEIKKMKVK